MFPQPLPDSILGDRKHRAEVKVYDALLGSTSPDYRAFYSFCWISKAQEGAAFEGEADFILAHAERGILVLEVKGGRIDHDGQRGRWTSTDRDGNVYPIDPVGQARRSKYALIDKLRNMPSWGNRWVDIGYAVVFPDCHPPGKQLSAELPAEIVIYKNDLPVLEAKLMAVFDYWLGQRQVKAIGHDGLKILTEVIAPDIHLRPRLGFDTRAESAMLLQLTEQQYRVLELLKWAPRVAVSGGAGTGKTFLALRKAELLATKEGRRTLLVCYNRTLAEYMRALAPQDPRLTVCTFHQLCFQVAGRVGIALANPDAPRLPSRYFDQEMPLAFVEALAEAPDQRFDAIVVDEGQDFAPTWWSALEMALQEPSSIFYVFHDDNQRVYPVRASFPSGLVPIALTHNLRNTQRVFARARPYYQGQEMYCDGPEGRQIEYVPVADTSMAEREVGRQLHRLIREEAVDPAQIAVLSADMGDGHASRNTRQFGAFLTEKAPGGTGHVMADTVRRFKGLERDIAILVLPEASLTDELLYVGFTRAKTHLIVLGTEKALAEVRKG